MANYTLDEILKFKELLQIVVAQNQLGDYYIHRYSGEEMDALLESRAIAIAGAYPTLADLEAALPAGSNGLYQTADTRDLYVWNTSAKRWDNLGPMQGRPGENGTTFTPVVSQEGVLSWQNNGDLPNPAPVDIKGKTGDTGPQGPPGKDAAGFDVLARYETIALLKEAHPTGTAGDAYAVGTEEDNEIYIWDVNLQDWNSIGHVQGQPGEDGPAGKSAYEYAVEGGYAGTEVEFAALLGSGPWVPETGFVPDSHVNLLPNWYFPNPVNQKEITEFECVAGTDFSYAIDSVIVNNQYAVTDGYRTKLILEADGIKATGTTQYQGIATKIECPNFGGLELTFSAIYKLYGNGFQLYWDGNIFSVPKSDVWSLASFSKLIPNTGPEYSQISFWNLGGEFELKIHAWKLEYGANQTLAHKDANGEWILNDIPDKSQQLLKCQRYYQVFATESLRPTKAKDFRPVMRIDPALSTIEINGVTYYTADAQL